MEELTPDSARSTQPEQLDVTSLVRQVVEEVTRAQQAQTETAYKAELNQERTRREQLERRLNDLVEENRRSRLLAELTVTWRVRPSGSCLAAAGAAGLRDCVIRSVLVL